MTKYNLHNKKFVLLENSSNGQVDSTTIFEYKQNGDLVTADYYGGTIRYGKIVAHMQGDKLDMLYQCLTDDNELKAGKAVATISSDSDNRIRLSLNWEWLNKDGSKGQSEYVEV